MKKKIVGLLVGIMALATIPLFGNLTAKVNTKEFYQGEEVVFQLIANGKKIELPQINTIGDTPIVAKKRSEQIVVKNNENKKTELFSYHFFPKKSLTIPSYEVIIDGKRYITQPIVIKKTIPVVSKKGDDFELRCELSRSNLFVGEPVVASLIFRYNLKREILDEKLEPFVAENFWVKELPIVEPKKEGEYAVFEKRYLLIPKQSGEFTLPHQLINIATKDPKDGTTQWKRVFSKSNTLSVSKLPNNLQYLGEFAIKASVDTLIAKENTPINITLTLDGYGNFDEIGQFPLELSEQTVYNRKPIIKTEFKNEHTQGNLIQKISIVSDRDFTIPPFRFSYFDLATKKEKTIFTEPITIKIASESQGAKQLLVASNKDHNTTAKTTMFDKMELIFAGGIGLFLGIIGTLVFKNSNNNQKRINETPIEHQIKKAKNDKELYDILLPYSNDQRLKVFAQALEENLYYNKNNTIDKKALLALFVEKRG